MRSRPLKLRPTPPKVKAVCAGVVEMAVRDQDVADPLGVEARPPHPLHYVAREVAVERVDDDQAVAGGDEIRGHPADAHVVEVVEDPERFSALDLGVVQGVPLPEDEGRLRRGGTLRVAQRLLGGQRPREDGRQDQSNGQGGHRAANGGGKRGHHASGLRAKTIVGCDRGLATQATLPERVDEGQTRLEV